MTLLFIVVHVHLLLCIHIIDATGHMTSVPLILFWHNLALSIISLAIVLTNPTWLLATTALICINTKCGFDSLPPKATLILFQGMGQIALWSPCTSSSNCGLLLSPIWYSHTFIPSKCINWLFSPPKVSLLLENVNRRLMQIRNPIFYFRLSWVSYKKSHCLSFL